MKDETSSSVGAAAGPVFDIMVGMTGIAGDSDGGIWWGILFKRNACTEYKTANTNCQ